MSNCAICGGTEAEHKGRQHAYTEKSGDLRTMEEKPKNGQLPPVTQAQLNRLTEVLLQNGLLTPKQGLYVLLGAK